MSNGNQHHRSNSSGSIKVLPQIIKGDADWRNYHSIELPNGVKCVFVHDKESKTTACSVCVGAGASSDPRELSGLAHFTEHMCFLGSEAYPGENEFKKFLSSHGGRSNASTSMSETTFKFDILSEHAEKAIDIFSNFFISPLFTESGTSREVNAVDSENSKNMSNDGRRRLQVLKALANPNHHYSKFSTGNAKTLAMDATIAMDIGNSADNGNILFGVDLESAESRTIFIREALLAFHRRHYRPDNMIVVVVGPQSLEKQQEWIAPRFASIVNRWEEKDTDEMSKAELFVEAAAKDAPQDSFGSPPVPYNSPFDSKYQSNTWPIMLTTLPLQSVRKLYIYFPLPSVKELKDQSPYHVICHLLGHEGPGSCFAMLQNAELIDAISVGPRLSDVDHSLLQVNISLTEKGEGQWEKVVKTIFDYCYLLYDTTKMAKNSVTSNEPGSKRAYDKIINIWDEVQRIKSLRFHQTSPGQALSLAPSLASSVRRNGTMRSMAVGSLIDENKNTAPIDDVLTFLEKMVPSNCFIERCSKDAWAKLEDEKKKEDTRANSATFGLKREKWYGVDYYLSKIDPELINEWELTKKEGKKNASLHLPLMNKYIPTDLSLSTDLPEVARKQPRIEKEIDPPNLIIQQKDFGRLWHRLDDRYCLPKASLTILFRNPEVYHKFDAKSNSWTFDPIAGLKSGLLMDTFADALAQTTYDAELAGLDWALEATVSGLVLKCGGYSQHLTAFASNILCQFFNRDASFINNKYVNTNKDRKIRFLDSYLKSKRADSYASYYTDLLLSSQGHGVESSLEITKEITTECIQSHHRNLISSGLNRAECLISGNISQNDAEDFFLKTREIISSVTHTIESEHMEQGHTNRPIGYDQFIPGPFERALEKGEDIYLHFQSQNPEEQNGAVRVQFQSPIPAFKGIDLESTETKESLLHTAAIRVLCQILREPLFNQLRTKEQLGYVVNSHYDLGFTSQWTSDGQECTFTTTPINSIIVNVLSRKVPPPVLIRRIDEFLDTFGENLLKLPDEDLTNHKDALRKQLLKPIRKLSNEVNDHFSKIRRFSPEVLLEQNSSNSETTAYNTELPWNNKVHLAKAIQDLRHDDILNVWNTVVAGKYRSRIVSHVYGSSFEMKDARKNYPSPSKKDALGRRIIHIDTTADIFEKRKLMSSFGVRPVGNNIYSTSFQSLVKSIGQKKFALSVAVGTSLLVYALNTAWSSSNRGVNKTRSNSSRKEF